MATSDKTKKQTQRDALLASYQDLRAYPIGDTFDLSTWFEENINACCAAFLGSPGRPLGSSATHVSSFSMIDNRPCLVLDLSIDYENMRGDPPDVHGLATFLPDIQIDPLPFDRGTLDFGLTFDLTFWPNLVPCVLADHLYGALIDEDTEKEERRTMLDEVQILLDRFYPTITLDLLKTAADLGQVDEDSSTFVNWFTHHLSLPADVAVELPTDLDRGHN